MKIFKFIYILIIIITPFTAVTSTSMMENKSVSIGVVVYSENFSASFRGLRDGIRDLGLINVNFEVENLHGDLSEIPEILKKFNNKRINIVFATTTPVNQEIMKYNDKYGFDVIFNEVAEPLSAGLVKSLEKPDKNFTGISHIAFKLLSKRFEIFTEVFPERDKILCFIDERDIFAKNQFQYLKTFRRFHPDVKLIKVRVNNSADFAEKLGNLNLKDSSEYGIVMMPHPLFVKEFERLKSFAMKKRIPVMVIDNSLIDKGGALGYSPTFYDVGYQSAYIAASIINGHKASDVPVQFPDKIQLALNLKILKKMGIKFNESYLAYANRIVNE
ncbi:ABC transporter substrate-binding protein [Flexistipes sp.]|uniref:ABC transporter substrate-binding protein n=1 Tax=Flexistipes sp. TaxID=3088135 RepID=UPI002E20E8DF|nr:ABC transporter substrate-binding protein [Flexistipes sp.]